MATHTAGDTRLVFGSKCTSVAMEGEERQKDRETTACFNTLPLSQAISWMNKLVLSLAISVSSCTQNTRTRMWHSDGQWRARGREPKTHHNDP